MEDCEGNYLIGCHKNLDHFWPGMVDDVVLIKKALDVTEVSNLMENGIESFLAKAVEPTDKLAAGWGRIKGNL